MKINAIVHKIGKENIDSFFTKIARAMKDNPDVIIGPDASLNFYELNSIKHKNEVYNQLALLSLKSDCLIAPGTITYSINSKEIVCEAPIFYHGKLLAAFHKEKDNGEGNLAEKNGRIYKSGDNSKNRFQFNGKNIALEICGDHGSQNASGCDLELILAHDSRAGFWIGPSNNNFKRKAVLCDGYAPQAGAFEYNPNANPRIKIIESKNKKDFVSVEI
jgi:predicted amidohydrolase